MSTCMIGGCDRGGSLVLGWCNYHYKRNYRTGDPLGNTTRKVKMPEARVCENCGSSFTRREGIRRSEALVEFAKRRFCSKDCARIAQQVAAQGHLHGTTARYGQGCRCDACRAVNSQRHADWVRRQTGMPDGVEHGLNAYSNWSCRCEVCRAAGAVMNALLAKRVTAGLVEHVREGRLRGCPCSDCRDYDTNVRGPLENARRTAENDDSRTEAHHNGDVWTGPEMEIASRTDLTARQVAKMLGRTIEAVANRRSVMKEPKWQRVLGARP